MRYIFVNPLDNNVHYIYHLVSNTEQLCIGPQRECLCGCFVIFKMKVDHFSNQL